MNEHTRINQVLDFGSNKDKININSWLIKNGYAVVYRKYSKNYTEDEKIAKKNKKGIWQGDFQMPWEWRKNNK